ncbi:DUF4091 domain-containing protein [Psychromicrobium xiongbiense]|uniref:DUF4091 domain-containing protein n=1 Tax=Psychromicrobium xiongbiense TaxID=3051184 RepID=UPI0025528E91|nr:DUF4091 domain-containing protein [Psychromicrobium sp. YIM S02556]
MTQEAQTGHGWDVVLTDSLEKVYPDQDPRPLDRSIPHSVLLGETASFQIALRPPQRHDFRLAGPLTVTVSGARPDCLSLFQAELVPVLLPAFPERTEGYDRVTPGLYPDLLKPLAQGVESSETEPDAVSGQVRPLYGQWTALWVDLTVPTAGGIERAGDYELTVTVADSTGTVLFRDQVQISVLPVAAPPLGIVNTHWLHCDGLAQYYQVPVFGEEHWAIIDRFVASAARMGVNSILTPTWTPPLDTQVDGYRLPTQLIGISTDDAGVYHFDFSALIRWMELCRRHGIEYLEVAHLFTQWGAAWTPAIYVESDGVLERRFGWDVAADSPEYRALTEQLIPALRAVLEEHWSLEKVIFHISDEPHGQEALASYRRAKDAVSDLLDGCRVVDALSDFEFYSSGVVPHPVVASDAVGPFLAAGVQDLWTYYCVSQDHKVANRFIAMPSVRNRVIGHQLFALGFTGFLHWGFNFYNTQYSVSALNPFEDTCAGGGFPGGDSFVVYPGAEGEPWESIRHRVFAQAMADHRAFELLAGLSDRESVVSLLDSNGAGGPLAMDNFSYEPGYYRRVREQINQRISQLSRI